MVLAKGIVLYDCNPQQGDPEDPEDPEDPVDQLSLKKNEIVNVTAMNEKGWLIGYLDGHEDGGTGKINPHYVGLFIEPKYIEKIHYLEREVDRFEFNSTGDIRRIEALEAVVDQLQINDITDRPDEPVGAQGGGKKKKNMRKSHKRKSHK